MGNDACKTFPSDTKIVPIWCLIHYPGCYWLKLAVWHLVHPSKGSLLSLQSSFNSITSYVSFHYSFVFRRQHLHEWKPSLKYSMTMGALLLLLLLFQHTMWWNSKNLKMNPRPFHNCCNEFRRIYFFKVTLRLWLMNSS